jgi:coproporphyrinogen III oxidase-like Fe-S oxidoreductase
VYWRNGHYAAAGVGAHGHLPAAMARGFGLEPRPGALSFRYGHGRSVTGYTRAVDTAPLAIRDAEWIDAAMRAEESIMLGLRLREGVSLEHAGALAEARELAGAGLLVLDGRRARVTARGEDVLNQLALRLATRCA